MWEELWPVRYEHYQKNIDKIIKVQVGYLIYLKNVSFYLLVLVVYSSMAGVTTFDRYCQRIFIAAVIY